MTIKYLLKNEQQIRRREALDFGTPKKQFILAIFNEMVCPEQSRAKNIGTK